MFRFLFDLNVQRRLALRWTSALLVLAITIMAGIAAFAPHRAGAMPLPPRGALLSATPVAELDAEQVTASLEAIGLDVATVRFGIVAHRVVYATIDPTGHPTTASALVVLPRNDDRDMRVVTWLHGTTVYRGNVASVSEESGDRTIAFAFAAAGYAVSAPDYLGLGLGPGFHPYDDFSSAATAAIDALHATRALAALDERRLDERVLVAGFSQGGPSALALGRTWQEGDDPVWRLGALVSIAGPHDFSGTVREALSGEISAAPHYLAYLVVAWNRLHGLYDAPGEAFQAPYDEVVETLFDGEHTIDEIVAGMPVAMPEELFTPHFLARLRSPAGPLQEALREADGTCDWRPDVPVRLYAASGDRDVPIANAFACQQALLAHGAEAWLTDVGDVDHFGAVVLSLPLVLEVFEAVAAA